jgi:phage gp36-like protein
MPPPMQGYPYPYAEEEKEAPKEVVVEKIVEVEKKDDTMAKEVEALRAMIKQQEDARIAREDAIIAAEFAKKLKAEQDALKAHEIATAIAATKAEAEKAAEDTARKTQEEMQALRDMIKQQAPAGLAQEETIEQPELAKKPRKRVLFGRKGWSSGRA